MFPLFTPPALVAPLQEINRSGNWKVGDQVELWHNWSGQFRWMIGKIEKIENGKYYVRFGTGKYNVDWFPEERLRNEGKEKEKAEAQQRTRELLKAANNYRTSLETLAWVADAQRWPRSFRPTLDIPEQIARLKADSEALAELNSKLGPATLPNFGGLDNQIWDHPEAWGPVLEQRKTLVEKAAMIGAASKAKWNLDRLRTEVDTLEKKDGWLQGTEFGWLIALGKPADAKQKILTFVQPILVAGGVDPAIATLKQFEGMADELLEQVNKLAPSLKPEYATADAALAAKLTPLWKKSHPSCTLVRMGFTPDWAIHKNDLGIILRRSRYGSALYRKPGCAYLIEETLSWSQDYAGAGKYVDAPLVHDPAFRFHK